MSTIGHEIVYDYVFVACGRAGIRTHLLHLPRVAPRYINVLSTVVSTVILYFEVRYGAFNRQYVTYTVPWLKDGASTHHVLIAQDARASAFTYTSILYSFYVWCKYRTNMNATYAYLYTFDRQRHISTTCAR